MNEIQQLLTGSGKSCVGRQATTLSRLNWIWLAPAMLMALFIVEGHTVPLAIMLIKLGWKRWIWAGLFSPSAYLCWSTIIASVVTPVGGVLFLPTLMFSKDAIKLRHRCLAAALVLLGIMLLPFVTDTVCWGSFPFTIDNDGSSRLRLIPFVPWPDVPYGTY